MSLKRPTKAFVEENHVVFASRVYSTPLYGVLLAIGTLLVLLSFVSQPPNPSRSNMHWFLAFLPLLPYLPDVALSLGKIARRLRWTVVFDHADRTVRVRDPFSTTDIPYGETGALIATRNDADGSVSYRLTNSASLFGQGWWLGEFVPPESEDVDGTIVPALKRELFGNPDALEKVLAEAGWRNGANEYPVYFRRDGDLYIRRDIPISIFALCSVVMIWLPVFLYPIVSPLAGLAVVTLCYFCYTLLASRMIAIDMQAGEITIAQLFRSKRRMGIDKMGGIYELSKRSVSSITVLAISRRVITGEEGFPLVSSYSAEKRWAVASEFFAIISAWQSRDA